MTPYCLIDANILIRHFTQDHNDHSPRATEFIRHLVNGNFTARIGDPVVFEVVFVLEKRYKVPRTEIAYEMLRILEMGNVDSPGLVSFRSIFQLYSTAPGLSFVDCHVAVDAMESGVGLVASFDQRLGRVPGITRFEPPLDSKDQ
ncbi:hypothetical protein BH09CHL1_BH09CHL1_04100 [soil metagenome]